jgi:energy-coupling factor transporter ATP-binding protein EcfA2
MLAMQKIIVRNFGPIKEAEVELGKLNLFIGEPASGKSTLAKLVYFFKSLKEDAKEFILYSNRTMDDFNLAIHDKFSLYFGLSNDLSDDFEVIYYYEENKWVHLNKYYTGLSVLFNDDFYNALNEGLNPLIQILRKSTNGTLNLVLHDLDDKLDILFNDNKKAQFIPALRSFTTSFPPSVRTEMMKEIGKMQGDKYQSQAKIDLFLLFYFEKQVQYMLGEFEIRGGTFTNVSGAKPPFVALNLSEKILRGTYQVRNGVESIAVEGREKPISLSQASSGQQEVIRLLQELFLSIVLKDAQFRVIEEPEAHLSPHRQSYLVEFMIETLHQATDNEMLLTTHSDHILNAILVGAKKFQLGEQGGINHEDIKVYYFASDEEQHKVVNIEVLEGGRIRRPPAGFFDQIGIDLRILMS